MSRAKRAKKQTPPKIVAERKRVQRALLDTYERLWKARTKEEGNTQAATMTKAGLSVQQWGNWDRGDDDMTLTSAVAVAFALGHRIDFTLRSLSDPSAIVGVTTDDEEGTNLTDDVMRLAEEIDQLPDAAKQRIMGAIDGLLIAQKTQRSPSVPGADHRGHGARSNSK